MGRGGLPDVDVDSEILEKAEVVVSELLWTVGTSFKFKIQAKNTYF